MLPPVFQNVLFLFLFTQEQWWWWWRYRRDDLLQTLMAVNFPRNIWALFFHSDGFSLRFKVLHEILEISSVVFAPIRRLLHTLLYAMRRASIALQHQNHRSHPVWGPAEKNEMIMIHEWCRKDATLLKLTIGKDEWTFLRFISDHGSEADLCTFSPLALFALNQIVESYVSLLGVLYFPSGLLNFQIFDTVHGYQYYWNSKCVCLLGGPFFLQLQQHPELWIRVEKRDSEGFSMLLLYLMQPSE